MDSPDSESWDLGATLTEDLSEMASVAPEDSLDNTDTGSGEFEVQGLGFDLNDGSKQEEPEIASEEANASTEPEYNVFADETTAPEMEPYAGQNEIAFELKEDDSTHQDKVEDTPQEPLSQGENLDNELSEISLETEFDLEEMASEAGHTPEVSVDLKDPEIELNSSIELEKLQLDLETDLLELEPMEDIPSSTSDVPEDTTLKMDSSEDEVNPLSSDEESTPDR